jgi:hypothetical protein
MDADLQPILAPQSPGPADDAPGCTAETADCTCPDFCERDHANE